MPKQNRRPNKAKASNRTISFRASSIEVETSNKTKEMVIKENIPVPVDVTIKALK